LRDRLFSYLDRLAEALERDKRFWLVWFTLLYLPLISLHAIRKQYWFDEFFTLYVSRLPHLSDLWAALGGGVEANPPLNYWFTRGACILLGENPWSVRLPAMLGFLLMSVCVFRFVARRCPSSYAAAAMLFPLLTSAYDYADEARPYGLLLGFTGLLLVLWQRAVDTTRRAPLLAALALTVAAALWTHYYAVFILVPIVLGEVCRWYVRKRFDPAIVCWLALGTIPALALVPLVRGANGGVLAHAIRSAGFWAQPSLEQVMRTYSTFLAPAIPALVAMLVLLALTAGREAVAPRCDVPAHEMVAAAGFAAMPLVVGAFTALFTNCYLSRYVLSSVVGCAILFGFLAASCLRRPAAGLSLAIILAAAFFVARGGDSFVPRPVPTADVLDTEPDRSVPIAVANPLIFTRLEYYGEPDLRSRLVYLRCPAIAVKYPDFVPDIAIGSLRYWAPLRVEEYRSFLARHQRFRVYSTAIDRLEWLVPELLRDGYALRLVAHAPGESLFEAVRTADQRSAGAVTP